MNLINDLEEIFLAPARCGRSRIIAIDGRAGAGKTTLANEIFLALSAHRKITVIHMDQIYDGWQNALGSCLTATLKSLLETIAGDSDFSLPIYNWQSCIFDSHHLIAPCDLIILEGVGSAQEVVRQFSSANIWLDIEPSLGLQRVLARDGNEIAEQMRLWQIDESELFVRDKTREHSDFILSTAS